MHRLKRAKLVEAFIALAFVGVLVALTIPAIMKVAYPYHPAESWPCRYCGEQAPLLNIETGQEGDYRYRTTYVLTEYGCKCGAHTWLKDGDVYATSKTSEKE